MTVAVLVMQLVVGPVGGAGATVDRDEEPVDAEAAGAEATTTTDRTALAPSVALRGVYTRADASDDVDPGRLGRAELAQVIAGRLVLAIDALAELDAFAPDEDPEVNRAIRLVQIEVPTGGLDDDGYLRELGALAEDLPVLVARLEIAGPPASDEVARLADSLDPGRLEVVASGGAGLFTSVEWIDAVADLVSRAGAAPANPAVRQGDIAALTRFVSLFSAAAPSVPTDGGGSGANDATASGEVPANSEASATTTGEAFTGAGNEQVDGTGEDSAAGQDGAVLPVRALAVVMAAVVGVAVAGVGVAIGRRGRRRAPAAAVVVGSQPGPGRYQQVRPAPTAPPPTRPDAEPQAASAAGSGPLLSVSDLLEASRRMTAALDAGEIAAIAIDEARRLVAADGGAVVSRSESRLNAVRAEPSALFRFDDADRSALRRVVETGRSLATVADDEPILVEVPMALAAVPIVADGSVIAALAAVRVPSRPFDRNDIEALETLAPLVGSALMAAAAHGSVAALAEIDALTGLQNRRCLDRDLALLDDGDLAAVVMVDVDHFKSFNDCNGHGAGDEALRRVAELLTDSVRPDDTVYRYGGEEFLVLLPSTSAPQAAAVAERARAAVAGATIAGGENQPGGRVTISVGVAGTDSGSVTDIVKRADEALYRAKASGRNRVLVSSAESVD